MAEAAAKRNCRSGAESPQKQGGDARRAPPPHFLSRWQLRSCFFLFHLRALTLAVSSVSGVGRVTSCSRRRSLFPPLPGPGW